MDHDQDHDDLDHDDDLDRDHEDQDDREAASRARSAEILAREPTPEELAEHAERCRQNRLAAIMAPSPPPIVFKRREPKDNDVGRAGGLLGRPAARAARRVARPLCGPATDREAKLVAWWAERLATLWGKLHGVGSHEMARELLREIAGADVAAFRRQGASEAAAKKRLRKLRKRIAVLEEQAAVAFAPGAKPRIRVPAGRQPVH